MPTRESVTSTSGASDGFGNFDVDLPATVNAGETLIIIASSERPSNDLLINASGWNRFIHTTNGSTFGGDHRLAAWWKKADGSEDGGTVTIDQDPDFGTTAYSAHCIRYSNAADPTVNAPEAGTKADSGTSFETNPDPPSLTPSGGSQEYSWIALFSTGSPITITGTPTNYGSSELASATSEASNGCSIGAAFRTTTAASQDPDTFTVSDSELWTAQTIAVYPTGGGGGSTVPVIMNHVRNELWE